MLQDTYINMKSFFFFPNQLEENKHVLCIDAFILRVTIYVTRVKHAVNPHEEPQKLKQEAEKGLLVATCLPKGFVGETCSQISIPK